MTEHDFETRFNSAVETFIEKLEPLIPAERWETIEFKIGKTEAGSLGAFRHHAYFNHTSGRRKWIRNDYENPAFIVISEGAINKHEEITLMEILPHEMAHAAQYLLGERVSHQGKFKELCALLEINSNGTKIQYDGFEGAEESFSELRRKPSTRYEIRHTESHNTYTISKNLWTRMGQRSRIGKNGELVNQDTCIIIKEV
jgi:hypothetical protein